MLDHTPAIIVHRDIGAEKDRTWRKPFRVGPRRLVPAGKYDGVAARREMGDTGTPDAVRAPCNNDD